MDLGRLDFASGRGHGTNTSLRVNVIFPARA
ncbi:hypothetical protein CABS01_16926 [Colletotrichum abscissum]|nr:uncharacterized protein CABS01_16926 [Colletotrichum abscissum]KAK1504288.1 hypothetical protein CABS01_16926 [Colletotrichum abscissum]